MAAPITGLRASAFVRGGVDDLRTTARGWRWGRRSLVPRSAEEFVPPHEPTVFPTEWSRSGPAKVLREVVQRGGLEPLFRSQVRTRVEGLDMLDRVGGPVIFAANHASHLDTPLILLSLPDRWRRRTAVAAAADYFFDTWWRAVGSALVFNTFPIERRGGVLAATPGDVLAAGWSLVVYPEGTRSHDGWMGKFRAGAAHLAIEHDVPIVPVAHRGTFAAMPRGRSWPTPGRRQLTVRFGEPICPAPGETARDLVVRVRDGVALLLDEDQSNWWQARRRAVTGATPDPSGPDVAQWRRVWAQSRSPVANGSSPAGWRRVKWTARP
jgi:1-acyl-sn-glycerol-3-phosphate acyltransferase